LRSLQLAHEGPAAAAAWIRGRCGSPDANALAKAGRGTAAAGGRTEPELSRPRFYRRILARLDRPAHQGVTLILDMGDSPMAGSEAIQS